MARRLGIASVLLAGLTVGLWFGPAYAGCHAFTVSADASSLNEGETFTITVARDGSVAPSEIRVRSVDGTALAPSDFVELDAIANFDDTATGDTSDEFTIETTDDSEAEADESFTVELSDPEGCDVNPNYSVGPSITLTIEDNDEGGETVESPSDPSTESEDGLTFDEEGGDTSEDDGGFSTGALVVIVVAVIVIGAALVAWQTQRRGRPPGPNSL